jgi:hypothetical protein
MNNDKCHMCGSVADIPYARESACLGCIYKNYKYFTTLTLLTTQRFIMKSVPLSNPLKTIIAQMTVPWDVVSIEGNAHALVSSIRLKIDELQKTSKRLENTCSFILSSDCISPCCDNDVCEHVKCKHFKYIKK